MGCVRVSSRLPVFYLQKRHSFFKYEGYSRKLWMRLQSPITLNMGELKRMEYRRRIGKIREAHRFIPQRLSTLGPDLATAHFVVGIGGAVKFAGSDMWFDRRQDRRNQLPGVRIPELHLEAVDCSNTNIIYESFDNFVQLTQLQYLSVRGCEYMDDWCVDRLGVFSETLLHLDISKCPLVSQRGLTSLHRLRKLRRLEMYEMSSVHQPEVVALMLEEALPECEVEGVDYTNVDIDKLKESAPTPSFIHQYIEVGNLNKRVDR